jgi:hypothetical protein
VRSLLIVLEVLLCLTGNSKGSLYDSLDDWNPCFLQKILAIVLRYLFEEQHCDLSEVNRELLIQGDLKCGVDKEREVRSEDLLDLYELVECLENLLDHVLLVKLKSPKD